MNQSFGRKRKVKPLGGGCRQLGGSMNQQHNAVRGQTIGAWEMPAAASLSRKSGSAKATTRSWLPTLSAQHPQPLQELISRAIGMRFPDSQKLSSIGRHGQSDCDRGQEEGVAQKATEQ